MSDERLMPDADAMADEARTQYQELFFYGGETARYVLTDLLNRLCLWEKIETDEELQRHNAAVEILEILGIGDPEDREGLIGAWLDYPINPLKTRRHNG